MKIYAFPRGGLSIDDPTVPPRDTSVIAFLPALSVLPLEQHSGGRRVFPLVNVGDRVREGMLIGRASGHETVNVYATVPGKVIRKVSWTDGDGHSNTGLVIRMEGAFERLGRLEEPFSWAGMNCYDLQRLITECGVAEMEGSGMPVAEKIAAFRNAGEPGSLVVRCVFDDPWLVADYVLCKERLSAVVEGSFIAAMVGSKVKRVVFAVSHGESELGQAMLAEASKWNIPASMVLVGSRYPQRNNRELELVLREYEKKENVPLGALITLGPASLAAVYDAVKFKLPPLDRYVAVGGSAVRKPRVMKVRIGKRLGELFAECGGFTGMPARIAVGTPILGKAVVNLDEPVTKTCYAAFALLKTGTGDHPPWNCINCGECRRVCPVGIDPEEQYKIITASRSDKPFGGIAECHGCGCCEAVCPSRLPLSGAMQGERRA